jgi:hypothetical protein
VIPLYVADMARQHRAHVAERRRSFPRRVAALSGLAAAAAVTAALVAVAALSR